MNDLAVAPLAILLYGSGLLIWPACALLWRKNRTRRVEIGAIIGFWMCIGAVWVWTVN